MQKPLVVGILTCRPLQPSLGEFPTAPSDFTLSRFLKPSLSALRSPPCSSPLFLSSELIFCHSGLTSHILSRKMASDMYWASPETGESRRSVVLTYELREMMTLLKRGQRLAGFIPEKPPPTKKKKKRSGLFLETKCNFPTKPCPLTLISGSVQLQHKRSLGSAYSS